MVGLEFRFQGRLVAEAAAAGYDLRQLDARHDLSNKYGWMCGMVRLRDQIELELSVVAIR
ncbi:MAG: hypothetical protein DCF29_09250 [Alphaproteobacteria bacterium]|nr:MAG: hypothetical protein DCF29_09250 [Alphaproteobacteria bacterium]